MSKKRYCYLVIALQAGLMLGAISNMMKVGAAEVAMAITGNIQKVFSQLNGEGKNTDMVNPHGIIFGEDAQINVGSIYVSTRNVNKIYLEAFESSSVLVGKITASKLGQADWPGGNQRWLSVKQQQGGGHFLGTGAHASGG
jgi:filamentous hemagglutinin family protein